MNLDKGLAKGIVKISFIVLLLAAFGFFVFNFVLPTFASSHISHADVTPNIVKGGLNYVFTVNVWNDGGDPISEFRIYNNTADQNGGLEPFTNLVCDPVEGWNGPYYISGTPWDFCQYTAKTTENYIQSGKNKTFTFSADAPTTDCWRTWNLETRDPKNYYTSLPIQIAVDAKAPETTKTYIGPQKKLPDGREWISSQTLVNLNAIDPQPHPSGVKATYYKNVLAVDEWCLYPEKYCHPLEYEKWELYTGPFSKEQESCHLITYWSEDNVGNKEQIKAQCVFVDNTPPYSVKEVGTPKKDGDGFTWVTQQTPITLSCKDPEPHPVDQATVWWRFSLYKDGFDGEPTYSEWYSSDKLPVTIYFKEDSWHDLEYYCVDHLGNKEETHKQFYIVDSEMPVIEKTIVGPQVGECPPRRREAVCYIQDGVTEIQVNVWDPKPHPVNDVKCEWWYYLDEQRKEGGSFTDKETIIFYEDSTHELHIRCKDALGNENYDIETFLVDSKPPETIKTYGTPYYTDKVSEWITSSTPITLTAKDAKVGVDKTYFMNVLVEDQYCREPEKCVPIKITPCEGWSCLDGLTKDFFTTGRYGDNNPTAGAWELAIWEKPDGSEVVRVPDNYGWTSGTKVDFSLSYNPSDGSVVYTVDGKTLSWTYDTGKAFEYIIPFAKGNNKGSSVELTEMYLNGRPISDLNSGSGYKGLRIYLSDVEQNYGFIIKGKVKLTWGTTSNEIPGFHIFAMNTHDLSPVCWEEYKDPFNKKEESCHMIGYYSVDLLGNKEPIKLQCVFVDNKPPVGTKEVGQPSIPIKDSEFDYWVTKNTPITLDCKDQGDHPVDQETVWWRFSTRVGEEWVPSEWNSAKPPVIVKFPEDSYHDLEFYCTDALGNAGVHDTEYFIVETVPPVITKTIVGPQVGNCPPKQGEDCYIQDGVTEIQVKATDPEPHPINDVWCEWGYWFGGKFYGWFEEGSSFSIVFKEDSTHELHIKCKDKLGNSVEDVETFLVDSKPPVTTKTYGTPTKVVDGYRWISSSTPITLTAIDNKVGVKEIKWRVTQLQIPDEQCIEECEKSGEGLWKGTEVYTVQFTIPDDSCHLIEFFAVDKLGNTEPTHKQCVFVDNKGPTPDKEVGEPNEACLEGEWCDYKITTMTPITLSCTDPEPHPSGVKELYFRWLLDGKKPINHWYGISYDDSCSPIFEGYDWTGWYKCSGYPVKVSFTKDTNHTLEFYCVDKVKNEGQHDTENFKVEGTALDIPLYKKWNLISVPFVLLDNDIAKVFDGIKKNISSVWKYDGFTHQWYVWTPDDAPENFDTIDPGYGYWVLAKDGTWGNPVMLTIGGSLFSPAVTPPDRTLVSGWNLIGYYGSRWQLYRFFPEYGQICGIPYEYPAKWIYGDNAYCSLNSLVNKNSGLPYWSTLEGYLSCGADIGFFYPIGACAPGWESETVLGRMYAGHGYWIHLPLSNGQVINYTYAPSTAISCIWPFEDSQCV